jgi:hypothetical protein
MFPSKTSLPISPFWQQSAPLLLCICFSPRHLSQSLPLGYVIHLPLSSIGDYWIFSFILFQRMNQVQRTVKCVLRFTKKKTSPISFSLFSSPRKMGQYLFFPFGNFYDFIFSFQLWSLLVPLSPSSLDPLFSLPYTYHLGRYIIFYFIIFAYFFLNYF